MKPTLYIAAMTLLASFAFAQDPPAGTQAKENKSAQTQNSGQKSEMKMPEMKTQSYSGMLADASCATSDAAAASGSSETTKSKAGDANRMATGEQGKSCSVSASTTQFALKLKDGRIVRLDDVGNERAKETLKNKKSWSEAAQSNKPIKASVTGVLNGDQLIATSVN
ncbi:MAG: hypothetical protein LAQ69_04415 [Acidobacteriia bacterium]|nr:hypothetical protein [Terriglobia bacterium]